MQQEAARDSWKGKRTRDLYYKMIFVLQKINSEFYFEFYIWDSLQILHHIHIFNRTKYLHPEDECIFVFKYFMVKATEQDPRQAEAGLKTQDSLIEKYMLGWGTFFLTLF